VGRRSTTQPLLVARRDAAGRTVLTIGIDPGQNTGAVLLNEDGVLYSHTFVMPEGADGLLMWIAATEKTATDKDHLQIAVEDYVGAGHLNRNNKLAIEVLGAVRFFGAWLGVEVTVQNPQKRMAKVPLAKNLLPSRASDHEVSACAHALAVRKPSA